MLPVTLCVLCTLQVFLPSDLLPSSSQTAAGCCLLTTDALVQPAIEQASAAREAVAGALARLWFGVLLRPATPGDGWLMEGAPPTALTPSCSTTCWLPAVQWQLPRASWSQPQALRQGHCWLS